MVSKRDALELHGLEGPGVTVFNMRATAAEKTTYNNQLRMLNPDCVIVDVDEFVSDGGSVRDSGADSYTARPLNLEALIKIIGEMTAKRLQHRQSLRDELDHQLRGERQTDPPQA